MTSPSIPPRVPTLPPAVPSRPGRWRRPLGRLWLAVLRWRVRGNVPDVRKMVIIVAPHTSNWDFVIGFGVYLALGLDASWFGKHSLFRWPFGAVFRYFGGIPIQRKRSINVVEEYVAEFSRRAGMALAIAPEGTRKRVVEWKTGFYHIARGAGAPIVPVALDFRTRELVIFPAVAATGDQDGDLARIMALFEPAMARHPAQFFSPRSPARDQDV